MHKRVVPSILLSLSFIMVVLFFSATGGAQVTPSNPRVSYPLTKSGNLISMPSATNARSGYLTSADHAAFSAGAAVPDPITVNGWTPASGTGTLTGIFKLAATGTGSATDTYISRDLSNNFVINAPSTGGFYALNGNAASFFSGPSGGGNRAIISGNGASDGLVVGGTLVINGQSSGVGFNALTAAGPSSIGATTVSTLKVGGGATVSQLAGTFYLSRGVVAGPSTSIEGAAVKVPAVGNGTIDTCERANDPTSSSGAGTCTIELFDKTSSTSIGSCTYTCGTGGTNASCFTGGTMVSGDVLVVRVSAPAGNTSGTEALACDYTY
jgi:hypothetical protein